MKVSTKLYHEVILLSFRLFVNFVFLVRSCHCCRCTRFGFLWFVLIFGFGFWVCSCCSVREERDFRRSCQTHWQNRAEVVVGTNEYTMWYGHFVFQNLVSTTWTKSTTLAVLWCFQTQRTAKKVTKRQSPLKQVNKTCPANTETVRWMWRKERKKEIHWRCARLSGTGGERGLHFTPVSLGLRSN